jgi:pimeloyl-ACP methyl ester carboxylesterase
MTAAVEPTSHTVEVRGLTLHYLDWGNEEAVPLVLLHGLDGAAGDWRRVAEYFQSRYHVIALDQRGHGDSDHVGRAYSTDDFVSDLGAFVDALGMERFILLGHSMGGHNAIAYTARNPGRVICAAANDISLRPEHNADESAKRFPGGQQPVYGSHEEWFEDRGEASEFTPEYAHALLAESRLTQVDGGYQPKADPNAQIYWDPTDLWDEARTITRPIFFLRAGRSDSVGAATVQEMDMAIGPARSIGLERSGHNTFLDMEEEFLSNVSQFFGAHGG